MNSDSAFRRTQSLRYTGGTASTSSVNFLKTKNSRQCLRSKSTLNRRNSDCLALTRLSFSQREALILSWRLLKLQISFTIQKIFLELKIVSPSVKNIFYKAALVDCFIQREFNENATLVKHVKYMIKFLDDLIMNINCELDIIAMVKKIGQQHAILFQSCGFEAVVWEQFGEIAMEKICKTDAVQKTREAAKAWRSLIAFITDQLRYGFDTEVKAFSRRSLVEKTIELDKNIT